jgi:magnesium transporter
MENGSQKNREYFLSEILSRQVVFKKKKIGKLSDLVIKEGGKIPEVTHIYVTRHFGNPPLTVPWEKVASIAKTETTIDLESIKQYVGEPEKDAILLKDHILDKKILDTEGREVEVVYDVKLVLRNNKLYVSDVDVSRYGLLRRIHLGKVADFIYKLAAKIKNQTISWTYIQPLPTQIGSFRGDVKLNILKEKLAEIHPVDLADILEELPSEQRTMLFNELDTQKASATLEEIDPSVQRDLIASLKKEKVVQLINQMTPGQAADILAVLPYADAKPLLRSLKEENARKIEAIIEKHEENILNYTTQKILKFSPDTTAEQAQKEYHILAKGKDVVMYLYIADENDKLMGVLDIKELLQAKGNAALKEVMIENVISLKPDSTMRDAEAIFNRYDFRAIPVTDEKGKIIGVVPYRDVMNLTHHFLE